MRKINLHVFLFMALLSIGHAFAQSNPPPDNPRPKKGDIPFSLRFHPDDLGYYENNNLDNLRDDWDTNIAGFNTDNILWHYPARRNNDPNSTLTDTQLQSAFLQTTSGLGYAVQYTIPTYTQHFPETLASGVTSINLDSYTCLNSNGQTASAPWETWGPNHLDISYPHLVTDLISTLSEFVEDGVVSFHQDFPGRNYSLLKFGGCFSAQNDGMFRDWLAINTTASQAELEIPNPISIFSIRDYVEDYIQQNVTPDPTDPNSPYNYDINKINKPIIDLYKQFTLELVQEHHDLVQAGVNLKIQNFYNNPNLKGNYSANNLNQFYWLKDQFDFWISEVQVRHNDYSIGVEVQKSTIFSKSTTFDENDSNQWNSSLTLAHTSGNLNRKMVPLTYSSGMSFVAPWDVYAGSTRLFGEPAYYADLFNFVEINDTANPNEAGDTGLFKGHTTIEESSRVYTAVSRVSNKHESEDDNISSLSFVNLDITNWGQSTQIKVGSLDPIFVQNQTGVGQAHITLAQAADINLGDPLWYIKDTSSGEYLYIDPMYEWSLNSPEIDVTTALVTNKVPRETPVATTISWKYENTDNFTIPVGSTVLIGETEYTTFVETNRGFLYFESDDVDTEVNIGDPIWSIVSPLGVKLFPKEENPFVINVQQKGLKSSSIVSGVQPSTSSDGTPRTEVHWNPTQTNFGKIPKGSTVLINDKVYTTLGHTGVGNLYIDANAEVNIGDHIWYIKNPTGETIYPATNHLTVSGINQGANNYPGRTTLNWTGQNTNLTIPIGSQVKVNDKIYTTTILSNVGNIYLPESAADEINVGDRIWFVYDNDHLILPENVNYSEVKMHVIRLANTLSSDDVMVKVKKHRFARFYEMLSPNSETSLDDISSLGQYNYYKIKDLKDWAVLDAYNDPSLGIIGSRRSVPVTPKNKVYPNPTSQVLHIRAVSAIKTLAIFDLNGRHLMSERIGDKDILKHTIDVKDLSTGIYFLNLETEAGTETIKFIKNE